MTDVDRGSVQPADELAEALTAELDDRLAAADAALAERFPGDTPDRQPVHTVYVPADRFADDLVDTWGRAAIALVDQHSELFRELVAGEDQVALVRAKLTAEPIEDLRIDFEDGYGDRGDEVEDADTLRAAAALARATQTGTAPPFHGIRFKSLEAPTRRRGIRTLTLFLSKLLEDGGLLDGFVVTLPKITSVEQVEAMVELTARLEHSLGLTPRQPALRAADRDTSVDPRSGRHRSGRPDDPRR